MVKAPAAASDEHAATAGLELVDHVDAPLAPSADRLREGIFGSIAGILCGLVRYRDERYTLGPLNLLTFGKPRFDHPAWVWPIAGGLLARRPGGEVRVGWIRDRLYCEVEGYLPRLPEPLYRRTQLLFHHQVTRIGLLHLRGRLPTAGLPAEPWRRLLAGVIDVAAAVAIVRALHPQRVRSQVALFAAALLAGEVLLPALSGQTPGGRVAGLGIVAADGSPANLAQLLLRLIAMPRGVRSLRDRHDELAGTEIILTRPR
ncbi:MAG: RDD family protein [Candidatus Dormibacteraceae bacterium]